MRTPILAFAIFAASAFAAIGSNSVSPGDFIPDVRFEVTNSASNLSLTVETLPEDFARLLEAANLPEWSGSAGAPAMRWVVLPNHGNAEVHVGRIEASRSGTPSGNLMETRFSLEEAARFASLGAPQVMRGIRMAPLAVSPVIKGDDGRAIVARRLDVEVEFTGGQGENEVDYSVPISREFESLMRSMTLNPPSRFPQRDLASPYSGRMLILRPSTLENEAALATLDDFANWKRRQGLEVTVASIAVGEQTPVQIRDVIREGYPDDPYDYVIIVGWYYQSIVDYIDPDATLRFPAFPLLTIGEPDENGDRDTTITYGDLFYAALDNEDDETDDWLPDVMIGRMVAHTPAFLQAVLNRSMLYEQDPFAGPENEEGAWYHRAILCEDNADTSSMLTDTDREMELWVENTLRRSGFSTTVFEGNKLETQESEQDALEGGVSIALADGYLFGMADSDQNRNWWAAATGRMHPFVVTNAHYYDYPHLFPFFSSGTFNAPNGPIGAVALTSSHWEVESRTLVGGALRAFVHGEDRTISNYWLAGAMGVMSNLVKIAEDDTFRIFELKQKYSQIMLLGDPSLNLFTDLPRTMTSDLPETLYPGATALAFRVTDSDNQPVAGATVCISQTDRLHLVGITDEDGSVVITIPEGLAEGNAQITVSKQDFKPLYLPNVPVEYPAVNLILQNFTIDPDLLVNGTSSALALTIENDGEQDGTDLEVEFHSDSPFLTFSRAGAALDDIASGSNGGINQGQEVRLILSPSCPGGTVIQVLLNLASRNDAWQAAFEVATSGPRYEAPAVDVVYENLEPGSMATVSPRLYNNGDRDGIALNATLVSLTDYVTVIDGNQEFEAIAADNSALPGNSFRIAVDGLFVPGQTAEFELRLAGEGSVDTALRFRKVISAADEGDPIGPDNYGYYAFDSGDQGWPEAPVYRWLEINPDFEQGHDFRGTPLHFDDNEELLGVSTVVELPFTFRYYGQDFDRLVVCSNGWVSFDTLSVGYTDPNNEGIPGVGAAPDAQLAIAWQDLFNNRPERNGVYVFGHEEAGFYVVEWSDIMLEKVTDDTAQFQIILYDPTKYQTATGDGEIKFQYRRFAEIAGSVDGHKFATIGVRSPDGNDGIQYRHYFDYNELAHPIEDEFAIRFTTALNNPRGRVRGRFARAENQQQALGGVHIFSYVGIDAVSAEDGTFEFETRVGSYEDVHASLRYFSDLMMSFEVRPGEVTDLGNLLMLHPEIAEVPDSVWTGLRPGFPTRQPVEFRNNGNGPLHYSASYAQTDGRRASFDTLRTFRIARILGDDITTTCPVYVSPHIFLPRSNNGDEVLTAIDLNGNRTGQEVTFPNNDILDNVPTSVTWDGTDFWGSFRYTDHPNEIVKFDMRGQRHRIFASPIVAASESDAAFITFSRERGTLFAVKPGVPGVYELSLHDDSLGQIINRWGITFPGDAFLPTGIGWNSWDTDNMPLYILDKYYTRLGPRIRGQRLVRFDPETGDYAIWNYMRNMNDSARNDRSNFGLAFMQNYDSQSIAMIMNETGFGADNDYLKFMSIGPNIPFVTGRLEPGSGTVQAGGQGRFFIPFDATGLAEGNYSFGIQIRHNGVGDSVFVPITLNVNRLNFAPGDEPLIPIEFGITKLYPNPFNSRIGIDFVVPQGERSILRVYDIAGREVATLFDAVTIGGKERIFWDAEGVSTGLYIMRLESGDRVMTRKAALIK